MQALSSTGNSALDWAIIMLAIVTIIVGVAAIANAVRINKEKHGEDPGKRVHAGDLHAIG